MTPRHLRCAIYTRKSTEEGLDQEFNSLDAQRKACEAYIQSQKHEGWQLEKRHFDDGGFSGGNLDRPAMTALLDEIKSGRIDVVVVYKVDRLTRSLADFAKIVDVFDGQGVSFVSVTQQFNTTTSMGRLTLNMLLSFAQFEREVTSERIRDKVAASKKKGMWMGGNVPLGYDNKDRALVINEAEAERVRRLFQIYLDVGNVRAALGQAHEESLTNKASKPFTRTNYYKLLQNHLYVGEIAFKGEFYPGQHQAIIDQETWEQVQAMLKENTVKRVNGTDARHPSLLAGKLFDDSGRRYIASHSVKKGKRYRYYVEKSVHMGTSTGKRSRKQRIAATEIETVAVDSFLRVLENPSGLLEPLGRPHLSASEYGDLNEAAKSLANAIRSRDEGWVAIIRSVIASVTLGDEAVCLAVDRHELVIALGTAFGSDVHGTFEMTVEAQLRRRGVELKLVIPDPDGKLPPQLDPIIIRMIVRAHSWWNQLLLGEATSIAEIAKTEKVTPGYIRSHLDLAMLSPSLTREILDGRQPIELSADRLMKLRSIPLNWEQQNKVG